MGSAPEALSFYGQQVLSSEVLPRRGEKRLDCNIRNTDGSDAVRLGDGFGEDLSPDGVVGVDDRSARRVSTGPCCQQVLDCRGRFRQACSWAAVRRTFCRTADRLCSEEGRRTVEGAFTSRTSTVDCFGRYPPEGVGTTGLATPDSRYVDWLDQPGDRSDLIDES